MKLTSMRNKSNIHADAAKTLHNLLSDKLSKRSLLNHNVLDKSNSRELDPKSNPFTTSSKNKEEQVNLSSPAHASNSSKMVRNLNIYHDNERLLDSFYESIQRLKVNDTVFTE